MKRSLLLLFGLFLAFGLSAQTKTISGVVTDAKTGETLPAVNVYTKADVTIGTSTDFDGKYTVRIPAEASILVYKSVGYAEKEVQLGAGDAVINVSLNSADIGLDEVVVSASKRSEKILDAPASVTVISAKKIEQTAALSSVDHLSKAPGIDVMKTGLTSSNVSVRGFNGVFSGSVLNMVDNRIARVPSLKVNAYQLIPINNADIERMEVIRGPGSALYGPNAADGVISIITKSPLDQEVGDYQTTISMNVGLKQNIDELLNIDPSNFDTTIEKWTFGERLLYAPEFRHSGRVSEKFGYKISGQFQRGNDWVTYDPREPRPGVDSLVFGTVQDGQVFQVDSAAGVQLYNRDFGVDKIAAEGRIDYQPTDDMTIILNGGFTRGSNIEPTGLGFGQAVDWTYSYGQARFSFKDFFFQYFLNSSDANDTYLIPQSGPNQPGDAPHQFQRLIDISKLHAFSVQHNSEPMDALRLIYGADVLLTRPNTEGSINGRFEDQDNINQYGAYIQGEYKFSDAFKVLGAIRGDYHDPLEEFQVSPRAALVYKPAPKHTLRATYNRAFNTPSTLNIALDLSNGLIPNGINVRGIGNPGGYSYVRDDNDQPMFMNPYDMQYYSPFTQANNQQFWSSYQTTLGGLLAAGAGLPPTIFNLILEELFAGMEAASADFDLVAIDYANVATGGDASDPRNQFDLGALQDFGPVKSEITQTYELGYKGLLADDRFFLNVDFYMTRKTNPRTGLETVAPSIIFDNADMAAAVGADAAGGLLHDNLAAFQAGNEDLYNTLLAAFDGQGFGSTTPNGSMHDELLVILIGGMNQLTLGTVSPENPGVGVNIGPDAILTYRNLDTTYTVFGADIGGTFLPNPNTALTGSFSWVSTDSIPVPAAAGGFISLNAPKLKFALGIDQTFGESGLSAGASFRWSDGFYANDAIYSGVVDSYNVLDLRVGYTPPGSPNTQFLVDVSNALGEPYRTYPVIPEIGRLTMLRIAHTF